MGAEKSTALEAGAQNRRQHSIQRTLGACCGYLLSVYVLESVIVNCSYEFQVFSKPNYQNGPRVSHLAPDNVLKMIIRSRERS
jgi:hypothetical protein